MYKNLVLKYISRLQLKHIKDYAHQQNINLSEEEATLLYHFIQSHSKELLEDNTTIFQLKDCIREDLFQQLFTLYQENKTKYL